MTVPARKTQSTRRRVRNLVLDLFIRPVKRNSTKTSSSSSSSESSKACDDSPVPRSSKTSESIFEKPRKSTTTTKSSKCSEINKITFTPAEMRGMLAQVIEETMLKTEIDCGQPVFDESVKDISAFQGVKMYGKASSTKFWSHVFAARPNHENFTNSVAYRKNGGLLNL